MVTEARWARQSSGCAIARPAISLHAEAMGFGRPRRDPVGPGQEWVWDYPRPPAVVPSDEVVRVVHAGHLLAESKRTLRVLETTHAPAYYIPAADVDWRHLVEVAVPDRMRVQGRGQLCGLAHARRFPVSMVCWWYANPNPGYRELTNAGALLPAAGGRV